MGSSELGLPLSLRQVVRHTRKQVSQFLHLTSFTLHKLFVHLSSFDLILESLDFRDLKKVGV